MSILDIASKIQLLTPQKQEEVADFIEFLLAKKNDNNTKKKRVFGSGKGLVSYMSDDFDEPLEDFKDYM